MNEAHSDLLMTVREVSDYLRLAESTVYRLAQEGRLPGRKIGGTWRFSQVQLNEWLRQQPADQERPNSDGADPEATPKG